MGRKAICPTPGCPNLTQGGPCAACKKQRNTLHRATLDPRYKTERWKRYSAEYRAQHPFCALCPCVTDVTDHVVPPWVAPERFFDPTNHQPLCRSCNAAKARNDVKMYAKCEFTRPWGVSKC